MLTATRCKMADGNKGLEMTLFTSADCFKKTTREPSTAIDGTVERKKERERQRDGERTGQNTKTVRLSARDERGLKIPSAGLEDAAEEDELDRFIGQD